jgi:hypothetical protein
MTSHTAADKPPAQLTPSKPVSAERKRSPRPPLVDFRRFPVFCFPPVFRQSHRSFSAASRFPPFPSPHFSRMIRRTENDAGDGDSDDDEFLIEQITATRPGNLALRTVVPSDDVCVGFEKGSGANKTRTSCAFMDAPILGPLDVLAEPSVVPNRKPAHFRGCCIDCCKAATVDGFCPCPTCMAVARRIFCFGNQHGDCTQLREAIEVFKDGLAVKFPTRVPVHANEMCESCLCEDNDACYCDECVPNDLQRNDHI